MNKKNYINIALLIVGLSIIILGIVLFFTIPSELKESFTEIHSNGYKVVNGEWGFRSGRDVGFGRYNHGWNRFHGGFMFVPLLILIFIPVFIFRKRGPFNYSGHGRDEFMKDPVDILRSNYAEGRITREEYLERKKILEKEEEI